MAEKSSVAGFYAAAAEAASSPAEGPSSAPSAPLAGGSHLGPSESEALKLYDFGAASPSLPFDPKEALCEEFPIVLYKSFVNALPPKLISQSSKVRPKDLDGLVELYGIPSEFRLRAPSPSDRPFTNRMSEACLFSAYFKVGVRLPFAPELKAIFSSFPWAFWQWNLNAFRTMLCYIILCRELEVPASPKVFGMYFRSSSPRLVGKNLDEFVPIRPNKEVDPLLSKMPNCNKGWKDKYFFAHHASSDFFWGSGFSWKPYPVSWEHPEGMAEDLDRSDPTVVALEDWRKKSSEEERCWEEILTKERLMKTGLIPSGRRSA